MCGCRDRVRAGRGTTRPPVWAGRWPCTHAKDALDAERHLVAATGEKHLAGVAVADSRVDPPGDPALRRDHIQEREPGVVDGASGLDEFFGPGYRLIVLHAEAEEPRIGGDGGGASRSSWSAAQRNAVRRLASSAVNQS